VKFPNGIPSFAVTIIPGLYNKKQYIDFHELKSSQMAKPLNVKLNEILNDILRDKNRSE
jgi:predicted house-cleaning noncanonical NTP pyrophosphatase (MazG superfamily)